mmetsp:Transcript_8696/g.12683  ORF Transcript_8696/g.12683 Transcript_8696/m.12683 type:complete len:186 (-) Transcript_8696:1246-1803(-)
MLASDIVPALPLDAVTESNQVTLARLNHDVALIREQTLSAAELYRFYVKSEGGHSYWAYCVESACVDSSKEIFMLMRGNDVLTGASFLKWLPMSVAFTRKHAYLLFKVIDTQGPSEDVMLEILQLFREVIEYAVVSGWSYERRLEFYHSFPFDELTTKEAVAAFRPVLFSCAAFKGCKYPYPESE